MTSLSTVPPNKPVNINISFNISRKQVTQKINTNEHENTISLQTPQDEDSTPNLKPKSHFSKAPQTPELINTDRHNLMKEFEFIRPTEQLKRKRKVKRGSSDYTIDRTGPLQMYVNDLDKSIQGHRRGYSTSFAKKQGNQTTAKKKKSTTKASDQLYRQKCSVKMQEQQKDVNKFNTTKSLKGMISKMISNELSKRSLPLPVVGNRAKYSQSTSLTNKKATTQKQPKKKTSKSQTLSKQKPVNWGKIMQIGQHFQDEEEQTTKHIIDRSQLLQKLGNFKSVQNSLLVHEAQRLQEQQEQQACQESKLMTLFTKMQKVQIRTDQSMECIGQIHELQRQKFKDEFFTHQSEQDYLDVSKNYLDVGKNYLDVSKNYLDVSKNQHTQDLLQTYITLLKEEYNSSLPASDIGEPFYEMLAISAQKIQTEQAEEETSTNIIPNRQQLFQDDNYLNRSDLIRVDELLSSQNHNKGADTSIKSDKQHPEQNKKNVPSFMLIEQVLSNNFHTQKQLNPREDIYLTKQHISAIRAQSNAKPNSNATNQQTYTNQQTLQRQTQEQKRRISQFKQQQIEKWGYLLDYIKANINRDSSTQQVLQHVYSYLSKAKVDLVQSGAKISNTFPIPSQQEPQQTPKKEPMHKDETQAIIKTDTYQQQQIKALDASEQEILEEQVRSFKDDYESDNDGDIKFMNLETIESALKNRLKILNSKKQKQLLKLQSSLEQQKIFPEAYESKKQSIEKWFKAETKQIEQVKKNIWKGYNEAKGILHKSYISTKAEKQHKQQIIEINKHSNAIKLQSLSKKRSKGKDNCPQKKERKMMKCLSESYLKKSQISYKQVIQEQERQLEEAEEEAESGKSRTLRRSKYENDDDYEREEQNEFGSKEIGQEEQLVDADMANISHHNHNQSDAIQSDQKPPQQQDKVPQQISLLKQSPPSKANQIPANGFSPVMLHYQQIPNSLGDQSYSEDDSEQSFNYYPSSHESSGRPYDYEDHKSVQSNKNHLEPSPLSIRQRKSPTSPESPSHVNQFSCDPSANEPLLSPPSIAPIRNKYQSFLQQKAQHLTEDDRQDIFEFLFLDLCIEIYQEPCYNNKIMALIHKFMQKQSEMTKRKKGVKTNLNVVKDYLKRFCGYMLRTNKKVLANMNVPMGPTALEMLRYMHQNESEDFVDDSEMVTLIVPIAVFDTFERSLLPTLQFEKYYDDEPKQQERVNFLKNIIHIHNKALFDALNEYLDQQRPFGIWGKPFPWKKSSSFSHKFTQLQHQVRDLLTQQKLKKSAQRVVEACSYVCGLLADKEQSLIGSSKVSPAYIQQIREDRISRMLANDMIQNQERWVFYDDEETEVMVEITNTIFHRMLAELTAEMGAIKTIRETDF